MARRFEHPQPNLFDAREPRIEMAAAQKVELATLLKTLLLEIATALENGEIGNDQDHL